MDAEIKKTWVEALRSDRYKQGRDSLNRGDTFCCLGVLCDIAVKSGLDIPVKSEVGRMTTYDNAAYYLPKSVVKWAGLDDAAKSFTPLAHETDGTNPYLALRDTSVANLNDNGYTFAEIADIIEEEL